ncbi:PEP-CTERM sorting domain-containing protein [Isosphaeraceae bacterium EP7]
MLKTFLRPIGLAALAAPALLLASSAPSMAGVVVSLEAAGVQSSTQGPVITETFDRQDLPPGQYSSIVSAIGTYTPTSGGASIVLPDTYGGANQTNYMTIGIASGRAQEVTLNLAKAESYFGFYFAAIDATNSVKVYDGVTLLTTIDRTSLASLLTSGYYGSPNLPGVNTGEPYAYVNVFGTAGQTFDRIVFSNFNSSGLESDNHSVAVPEPASLVMTAMGGLALVGCGLRRRSQK